MSATSRRATRSRSGSAPTSAGSRSSPEPTSTAASARSSAAWPAAPSTRRRTNPSGSAAISLAMLLELRIENLLLIERAELRLGSGLNAITGETGAGKTVLAHSLDLLMGGKARPQVVRPGASEAYVEG